ncbi:MAG TPA: hypothetical protein VGP79_04480 [Bryobacteraceae bacterium]|jgi:hypothetical protein|nr:hypothetical protein [Bryobacteraceae bacterium]
MGVIKAVTVGKGLEAFTLQKRSAAAAGTKEVEGLSNQEVYEAFLKRLLEEADKISANAVEEPTPPPARR